ncbi:MAG TPA: aminotransferase class I/II-fold pyridoxal phosphate-dependent enzyme, partial [Candidatus Obscuribacter sp.]|nr:aminotransferase class I/II-fold pyridoxal phosphate-dependent enzyme [Candidatus Obscuribacter sp.]
MNPGLDQLQQYPFERLNALKAGLTPPPVSPIVMAIGEPKHEAPDFVLETLKKSLGGLSIYPLTAGTPELREAIAGWLSRRFQLAEKIQACHVLPVNGTREALFAVAQCFAPGPKHKGQAAAPPVLMPNPFYQIYEGAALLCGARPYYIDIDSESGLPRYEDVPESVWQDCTLLYVCTPGNPTGAVMPLELLGELVKKALKYNFVIASDECYSELYFDEGAPPAGILQAALKVGNDGLENCLAFHSLSKRSSLPGMRSGFVAGNANLIETFRLYRTYQGGAMPPPIQTASIAAWNDEAHVQANRAL